MAVATVPGVGSPTLEAPESPFQIRAALAQDAEAAWELQRAAFDLPAGEPPPHPGEAADLQVVVRDGKIVSCLTLLRARLSVRGVPLRMGGLRHVATHPEEQNQGYASALIRHTLRSMREQGLRVSVLFPFSFRYYRKFGYELGGNYCHFWCRPSSIPAFAERADCRTAAAEDCRALETLYRDRIRHSVCALERDSARWSAICADPRYTTLLFGRGEPQGYAVLEETRDSYGGRLLRVLDLCAGSQPAWRGLLGHLSQAPVESVEWLACAEDLVRSGLLRSAAPLREGFKPRGIATVRPMFQFRVTDLQGTLEALAPAFPTGRYRLGLRVRDDLIPENTRPLTLHRSGDRFEVRPSRPSDPWFEADVRILSQIVGGYLSPTDAVSQDLACCNSPEALETAERLFPVGDPFLSELDRF